MQTSNEWSSWKKRQTAIKCCLHRADKEVTSELFLSVLNDDIILFSLPLEQQEEGVLWWWMQAPAELCALSAIGFSVPLIQRARQGRMIKTSWSRKLIPFHYCQILTGHLSLVMGEQLAFPDNKEQKLNSLERIWKDRHLEAGRSMHE